MKETKDSVIPNKFTKVCPKCGGNKYSGSKRCRRCNSKKGRGSVGRTFREERNRKVMTKEEKEIYQMEIKERNAKIKIRVNKRCKDCGILISPYALRCNSCHAKYVFRSNLR